MTVLNIAQGPDPQYDSNSMTSRCLMKRIAAPMVGGMVTSSLLTLIVIPAICSLWKEREMARAQLPVPN